MKEQNKREPLDSLELDKDKFFTLTEDLFFIVDSEGNIKWANPSGGILFGDNQTARNILTLIHPSEIEKLRNKLHQLSLGYAPTSFEMKISDKNSGYKWYLWNSVPYQENGLYYLAGRDITIRKQNEDEIRLFYYTSRGFGESNNLPDSLKIVITEICRITNWPYAEAFTKDAFSGKLVRIASWHERTSSIIEFDELYQNFVFDIGQGIIGKTWIEKQPRWVENIFEEKDFLRKTSALKAHLNSLFLMPVITGSETIAVIAFFMFERNTENERLVNLISAIVSQLSNLIERKQIEEKLRRNEKLLRNTEKMARIGSWEWKYNKQNISWSDEMYSIFGLSSEIKIEYNTFLNILSKEGSLIFSESIKQIALNLEPFVFEDKIIISGNEERYIRIKGEAISNESKNIYKVYGTVQDITLEKQTNEKLIRSELYYRSLIENSLDLKSIVDPEGNFKFISPSVTRILGYSAEAVINKNLFDYIHPDDQSALRNMFFKLKETSSLLSMELRFRNSENNYCFFESIMMNLSDVPYVEGIIINSRDITAKKNAETAIKTLMEISWKLNSTLDADELMDILILEAMKLIGSEMGTAGLRTAEGLTSKKLFIGTEARDIEYNWSPGEGIPGKVLEEKKAYIINDPGGFDTDFIKDHNVRNIICVPILDAHNRVIGFFQLMNRKHKNEFTTDDSERSLSLAQTASTVIQNALAYQKILMTEAQLKNSREQLRRLSAHLQSAREEERTRIAREIHDELGQSLTGLKMDLSWLDKKLKISFNNNTELLTKLEAMGNLVDSTIKTVRKISSELRPGVLDYLGLGAAVEWQAQDFQNRTGIVCNLTASPRDFDMEQNSSTAVFRIFQETLTNVARHSKATEINIRMMVEDNNFILEIKDNGRGITDAEIYNNKSLGLLGMRERANLIGGDFHIKGTSTGTTVSVIIPYDQNEKGEGL